GPGEPLEEARQYSVVMGLPVPSLSPVILGLVPRIQRLRRDRFAQSKTGSLDPRHKGEDDGIRRGGLFLGRRPVAIRFWVGQNLDAVSRQAVEQIVPVWIRPLDQIRLPVARPAFQRLLPL